MNKTTFVIISLLMLFPVQGHTATWSTDMNCDGETDVIDVVLLINEALSLPMNEVLDGNGNAMPDACEGLPGGMFCGEGTEPNVAGDTCVVSQAVLDQAYADGVASVDITIDNQFSFDAGYADGYGSGYDQGYGDGYDQGYGDGFAAGVSSVDCEEPLCEGMESVVAYFDTPEGATTSVSGGCNVGCFGYATSAGTSWAYLCEGVATVCPSIYDDCSGSCASGIVCEGDENCVDGESVSTSFTSPEGSSVGVGSSCNAGCFGYGSSAGTSWGYICDGVAAACPSIYDDCSGSCASGIVCESEAICQGSESVSVEFEKADGGTTTVSGPCSFGCFGYGSAAGTAWAYLCDGVATACPSVYDNCSGNCSNGIVCEGGNGGDSCAGNCFGQAPGGCYCDQACVGLGDCCSDACLFCGFCGG